MFSRLRPLDEHDRVVEVGLEVSPLGCGHLAKAEEVEVRHVDVAPVIAMADRVRGACHGLLDAERPTGAAHERRLAGTELAGDGDNVANPKLRRELGCDSFRLFRRARGQNRPS